MTSLSELERELEEAEEKQAKWYSEKGYQDENPYNHGPCHHLIAEIKFEIELVKNFGEDWEYHPHGVVIENRYILTPNHKWRVVGRDKWYRYKNIEDFKTKYFKSSKRENYGS